MNLENLSVTELDVNEKSDVNGGIPPKTAAQLGAWLADLITDDDEESDSEDDCTEESC